MNDQQVYTGIKLIVKADISKETKIDMLDKMTFEVWNCHPDGMAAKGPLEAISKAIEKLQSNN